MPAIWIGYSQFWVRSLKQTHAWLSGNLIVPEGWISAVLCSVMGLGTAVLVCIATLNRHRARLMFRRTTAKLVASGFFAAMVPIGLFGAMPLGGWIVLLALLNPVKLAATERFLPALGLAVALAVGSYAIVSMVLYGIRHRAVRVSVLVLVWCSLYAVRVLYAGIYNGPL